VQLRDGVEPVRDVVAALGRGDPPAEARTLASATPAAIGARKGPTNGMPAIAAKAAAAARAA
jgi:hypothetical protein